MAAPDVSSLHPDLKEKEAEFAAFLVDRLQKAGGTIVFQHLMGHLSQLQLDVRSAVGTSSRDVMGILRKCHQVFEVSGDGTVRLRKGGDSAQQRPRETDRVYREVGDAPAPPARLDNVAGVVIKVCATFGFIVVKEPFKTTVYFVPSSLDRKFSLFTDLPHVVPGKKVLLNALKGNEGFDAKYRATRVWFPENTENEVLRPEGFVPKAPRNRREGRYDADSLESRATVQKVFGSYAFAVVDGDRSNNVFLHAERIANAQNVTDLKKLLRPGHVVEFKAVRSKKPSVRWEATRVWVIQGDKSYLQKKSEEEEEESAKADDARPAGKSRKNNRREVLKALGKVYPRSDGIVIKFDKLDSKVADADSCLFYLHRAKVVDISWEFSDGDSVQFEYVEIQSFPGFKALLAWVGQRPDIIIDPNIDLKEPSDPEMDDEPPPKHPAPVPAAAARKTNAGIKPVNNSYYNRNGGRESATDFRSSNRSRRRQSPYSSTSSLISDSSKNSFRNSASRDGSAPHSYSSRRDDDFGSSRSSGSYLSGTAARAVNGVGKRTPHVQSSRPKSPLTLEKLRCSSKESLTSDSDLLKPSPNRFKSWADTPWSGDEEAAGSAVETAEGGQAGSDLLDRLPPADTSSWSDSPTSLNQLDPDSDIDDQLEKLLAQEEAAGGDVSGGCAEEESPEKQPKPRPYVKVFRSLRGTLKNVYCRYAKIEHADLNRAAAALMWSEFYYKGELFPDKYDDMNEVLKPGQPIMFNCIEIVDEKGVCHQKVTLAWAPPCAGRPPGVPETSPRDYIAENQLQVSAEDVIYSDDLPKEPQSMRRLNSDDPRPPPPAAPAARKFLAVSAVSDDEEEEKGRWGSTSEEDYQLPPSESPPPIRDSRPGPSFGSASDAANKESNAAIGRDELAQAVSKLILRCRNSEVDLTKVTEDVINTVLNHSSAKRKTTIAFSETANKEVQTSPLCVEETEDDLPKAKLVISSSTQTIVTGKIFSESFLLGEV